MLGYEFINRTRIECGENALLGLINHVKEFEFTNVMIITGPVLERLGVAEKVRELIEEGGARARVVFSDVPNDGSINVVKEIVRQILVNNINGIVAIGGGSVLDTAKAVKYMCCDSSDINEFIEGMDAIRRPLGTYVPLICIPTTCGTGSEITPVVVLKDDVSGVKTEVVSSELLPDICLLTDEFIGTLPEKSAFFTAIDALTHSIEALTSLQKNPISDAFAITAISKIGANIDNAADGDTSAKYELLRAANIAGTAFANAMVGLAHAIAHSLGSHLNISHDVACALTLPKVMRFNLDKAIKEYTSAAMAYGDKYSNVSEFIDYLEEMIKNYSTKFNVKISLNDYGLNNKNFDRIVSSAYRDGARVTNTKNVSRDDIANILRLML